jgi:parallel beta-helix repeat protein
MKREGVALFLVLSLLTLSLAGTGLVGLAHANFMPLNIPSHNIEITADGNVTGTNGIQRNDATYEFTADVSGGILVSCDNITINGNGYSLIGNGESTGLFLQGRQNVTIKNLTVSNFERAIVYSYYRKMHIEALDYHSDSDCRNNALIANNITNNQFGVYSYLSQNIAIRGNTISNNGEIGISIFDSGQIEIYGNTLLENNVAVRFTNCQHSSVFGNSFIDNVNQTSVDPESNSGLVFGWSTIEWVSEGVGNFWSDYVGVDANHDGIGDKPYVIDDRNTDYFPVMTSLEALSSLELPSEPEPILAPEPFLAIITAFSLAIAIVGAGLFIHHRKKRRQVRAK